MRRVLCFVICVLLLIPMAAGAEGTRSVSWSLEGNVLCISGEGAMDFSEPFPWEDEKDSITTLRIGEGITEIQAEAFRDFSALQYLAVPKTLRYIGDSAFENCPGLRWVSFPKSLIGIGERAFANCSKLAPVYVPDSVAWVGDRAFDTTATINCYANSAVLDYIEDNGGTYRQTGTHALASTRGTWGENGKWTLEDGTLTLTGKGTVSPEKDGRYAWDAYRGDILTVELGDGITALEGGAFALCRKLIQITFPESIASIAEDAWTGEPELLGYTGTAAETFASDNQLKFTALDAETAEETEAAEPDPEAETEPTGSAPADQAETEPTGSVPADQAETEPTGSAPTDQAETEPTGSAPADQAETEPTGSAPTDQTGSEQTEPTETEPEQSGSASDETEQAEQTEPDAAEEAPKLTLETAAAQPGQTVTLTVSLSGNTGLSGLYFGFDYDKTLLTLEDYSCPSENFAQGDWTVGIGQGEKALWLQPEDTQAEGEILKLTFRVSQDAGLGEIPIALTDITAVNANADEVAVSGVSGGITVSLGLAGDVNGDGQVTNADLLRLRRYLSGQAVSAETGNADLNNDGRVDLKDLMLLQMLLTGQSEK